MKTGRVFNEATFTLRRTFSRPQFNGTLTQDTVTEILDFESCTSSIKIHRLMNEEYIAVFEYVDRRFDWFLLLRA